MSASGEEGRAEGEPFYEPEDFVEDEEPGGERVVFLSNERPIEGLVNYAGGPAPSNHKPRLVIAGVVVGVLTLLHTVGVLAVVFGAIDAAELVTVTGALSGLQTLAGAAVGFYFSRGKDG